MSISPRNTLNRKYQTNKGFISYLFLQAVINDQLRFSVSLAWTDSDRSTHGVAAAGRWAACCLLVMVLGFWAGIAASDTSLSTAITPQPLAAALDDFAHQTGLQLVYVSQIAAGHTSNKGPLRLRAFARNATDRRAWLGAGFYVGAPTEPTESEVGIIQPRTIRCRLRLRVLVPLHIDADVARALFPWQGSEPVIAARQRRAIPSHHVGRS